MRPTALIVGSNVAARDAIERALSERIGIDCAGQAATPGEAVDLASSLRPNVVVVGRRLERAADIQGCREIRDASPSSKLVALTWYAGDRDWLAAVLAGASACLLLEVRILDALAGLIQRVLAGENVILAEQGENLAVLAHKTGPLKDTVQRGIAAMAFNLMTNSQIAEATALPVEDVRRHIGDIVRALVPAAGRP